MTSSDEGEVRPKRKLKKLRISEDSPSKATEEEDEMVNWLRNNRGTTAKTSHSDEELEPVPKKPRKKSHRDESTEKESKAPRQSKKFDKEREAMKHFMTVSTKPASPVTPASDSNTISKNVETKPITDVKSFFQSCSGVKFEETKKVNDFDWGEKEGIDFLSLEKIAVSSPIILKSPERKKTFKRNLPAEFMTKELIIKPPSSPTIQPGNNHTMKNTTLNDNDKKKRPWEGQSVVITGNLTGLSREEAIGKIHELLGGKTTGAVSTRTAYLVTGALLEDGRPVEEGSKYRKTIDLREQGKHSPCIVTEDDFVRIIASQEQEVVTTTTTDLSSSFDAVKVRKPQVSQSPAFSSTTESWVDKYKPHDLSEVVGNHSTIVKLETWLRDWFSVVVRGEKKPFTFGPNSSNPNSRGCLVSGPPGIGKTSACKLVGTKLGYQVIEFNASDTRNKSSIDDLASGLAGNKILDLSDASITTRRTCLVMDEVDGMSGGDRGGSAALIQLIKKTRIPVICICNDRMSPKVRSLANSCYDLRFQRPSKQEIANRASEILRKENVFTVKIDLVNLAESVGNDIRQVVNTLELMSRGSGLERQAKLKDEQNMLTPFDACKQLLTLSACSNKQFNDKIDLVFVDYDLVPLLIQQNYVKAATSSSSSSTSSMISINLARASNYISFADQISRNIRQGQNWTLLSEYCVISSVAPSLVSGNFIPFPEFPQWLGKNSHTQKNKRLLSELKTHLPTQSSARNMARSGYTDVLYSKIVDPLKRGDVQGSVNLLNQLEVSKELIMENCSELKQLPNQADDYKEVDPKVKASFTRTYNSSGSKIRGVGDFVGGAKKKKDEEGRGLDGEEDDAKSEEDVNSESEEGKKGKTKNASVGGFIKAVEGKAKASSLSSSSGKASKKTKK